MQAQSLHDLIHGSFMGAVLGDCIGSYLQFDPYVTKQKIHAAMKVPGGGKHHLESGQPTDDSELNYAVSRGLLQGKGKLDLNSIAHWMSNWFISKPIDVGGTIRNSIPKACNMKVHQAHLVRKGACQKSQKSQSNGSLMAITGISCWCHKLKPQQIIKAIEQYTILIHPSPMVVLVNSFYTLCLTGLINKISPAQAYQKAKQILNQHYGLVTDAQHYKVFQEWLKNVQESQTVEDLNNRDPIHKKSGWCKHAFSLSIFYLKKIQKQTFPQVMEQLMSLKGDTDTNACIVGGMIGAYYGYSRIHIQMKPQIDIIMKWRPKKINRPQFMVPGISLQKYVLKIQEISPNKLDIIGGKQAQQPKHK